MPNKELFDVNDIDDKTLASWVRHAACGCGVCGSMIGVSLEGQRALVKGDEHPKPKKFMHALQLQERLSRITKIIEIVDYRCMATDGPVTATLQEMTQEEISEIYKLANWRD